MGFRHEPKTFRLVFDDPALEGLEVKARSLSIGELHDPDIRVFESFAKALVSWNLEDENGNPLPATLETIEAYPDVDFMTGLTSAWMDAVTGVDKRLGKGSPSGEQSLEGSIPMETLLPSQAS